MTKIRQALKTLSDDALLRRTLALVTDERRIGVEVLWYLIEIERRLLHAQRGFGSLHAYMTEQLHYTPAAAQRRIQAMRLLVDMPEAAASLQNGELSVTTMSQLQYHVKNTAPSLDEKRMLLENFKGKSERECEKIVAARPGTAAAGTRAGLDRAARGDPFCGRGGVASQVAEGAGTPTARDSGRLVRRTFPQDGR